MSLVSRALKRSTALAISEFGRKVRQQLMGPSDPYFYLLENPGERDLELCNARIPYKSSRFDQATYERSRGASFRDRDEAYADWVSEGRKRGLSFAPGKNTTLKIIIKVKDEPELLERWIEHHAGIVGYENLIILDTGSVDPHHLAILRKYEKELLTFKYKRPYDTIHVVQANLKFYSLLIENCRYLTVLDADEFLLYRDGDVLSKSGVVPALGDSTEPMHCGTWIHNASPPRMTNGRIDWDAPFRFSLNPKWLVSGTYSGKAILRSNALFQAGNIGHNMHTRETLALATPNSVGHFVVMHLAELGAITKTRELKHVMTHVGRPLGEDVEASLRAMQGDPTISRKAQSYIGRYLNPVAPKDGPYFSSAILSPAIQCDRCEGLGGALERLNFEHVIKEAEKRIQSAASKRAQ